MPAHVRRTPEQRVAEVAASLRRGGLVTGWAALWLAGNEWFDGVAPDGRTRLPVPVRLPHGSRHQPRGAVVRRARFVCGVILRHGIPCADPETAVLDGMELAPTDRRAVAVMEMAAAGRSTSIARVRSRFARDPRRRGRRWIGGALDLASEHSCSPRETEMALVWQLDAGFPRPLRNVDLVCPDGTFICRPDLFDVVSGTCGEYDGAEHAGARRRAADERRRDRAATAGLERFTVLAGMSRTTQVERMRSARARARWLPPDQRRWRVRPRAGRTLDEELDDQDRRAGLLL